MRRRSSRNGSTKVRGCLIYGEDILLMKLRKVSCVKDFNCTHESFPSWIDKKSLIYTSN